MGISNWSKAKAIVTLQHATLKLVPLREQEGHQRREPIISLALLRAPMHVAVARAKTPKSDEQGLFMSKSSQKLSLPLASDEDSSAGAYRGCM